MSVQHHQRIAHPPVVSDLRLGHWADTGNDSQWARSGWRRGDAASGDERDQALHLAVRNSNLGAVQSLLEAGADVHHADVIGNTPLHDAVIFSGRLPLMDLLLRAGASVSARNHEYATPLAAALAWAHYRRDAAGRRRLLAVTERLLTHGASPHARDHGGVSLLSRALALRDAALVRRLLAAGATWSADNVTAAA